MLCISLLFFFFTLKSCPPCFVFCSRNLSEDVLGWRESFDLLLSSKSEYNLLMSVCGCGTRVLMCLGASPRDAESVGKIIAVAIIIMIP